MSSNKGKLPFKKKKWEDKEEREGKRKKSEKHIGKRKKENKKGRRQGN